MTNFDPNEYSVLYYKFSNRSNVKKQKKHDGILKINQNGRVTLSRFMQNAVESDCSNDSRNTEEIEPKKRSKNMRKKISKMRKLHNIKIMVKVSYIQEFIRIYGI